MATVFGKEPKEYVLQAVWEDWFTRSDQAQEVKQSLKGYYDIDVGEGERVILLDNTRLCYEQYGVELTEDRICVWGSYRSFLNAYCKLAELLWSNRDLTEADSFVGAINLPPIPLSRREDLLAVLEHLMDSDRLLYGQHLCGSTKVNVMLEQYQAAVGQGPSIIDFDMIGLRALPRGEWSRALCELVEYAAKGGVITTMHHWLNPVHPESNTYRGSADGIDNWNAVLTRGTALNKEWHLELDRGAEFLSALQAAGVTVIYRPQHEANGNWFWFGFQEGIGGEELARMFRYVREYYVKECGLTTPVWCYSPNISEMTMPHKLSVRSYYPGDDACDIVACDWYTGGDEHYEIESEVEEGNSHARLMEYGKPFGLAELGFNAIGNDLKKNCEGLIRILKRMASEGKRMAFVEVYGGGRGAPYFVGHGEAIREYAPILSLEEMPAFIDALLGK